MDGLRDLLNEQARAHICGPRGHSWRFVLPVEKRDESREISAQCAICSEKRWLQLSPDEWTKFLKDLADGKIK